ncbi:MAG: isochorismatase family protein [Thermoleophilaceae bacterium]
MSANGSSSALLVIDMQQQVVDTCPDGRGLIERINSLSRRAAEGGVPVIFIQHEGHDELFKGTPGWELAAGLERADDSFLVRKTYRDAFADTELQALLERLGVRRLVVTGAHSDFCVQTSALSALFHGFDLALVSDGHGAEPSSDDDALSAQTLQAFVNTRFATLRHPGRTVEVVPAADVEL